MFQNQDTARSNSTIDDSVQKSILRNRLKAMRRDTQTSSLPTSSPSGITSSSAGASATATDFEQRMEALRKARERRLANKSTSTNVTPSKSSVLPKSTPIMAQQPKASMVATRRSLPASADEIEFVEPIKRRARAGVVKYKSKTKKFNISSTLYKAAWGVIGLLVLRLIFVDGGVIDYFKKESLLNSRRVELANLQKENQALLQEIERIKTDRAFQKRLIRDHLGMIGSDEYLVIFAKDGASASN